jgi:ABC-type transporter Mla MlaB component
MIRISTKNEPRRITITIDGQLAGDDVDAVEKCCSEATGLKRQVRLFLREVSNIDTRGLTLLGRLAAKGFELSASGVYSSYIVEEVRRDAGSDRGLRGKLANRHRALDWQMPTDDI